MIYDLSVPIRDGSDWYGEAGTAPVALQQVGSYDEGWVSHHLSIMVLNGCTYLETGAHLYPDMPTLDQLAPGKFLVRAHVVSLPAAEQELLAPALPLPGFRPSEDAILLNCGWDTHVEADDYYHRSPYCSPQLQQWLLDHEPAILGGDMLSYDHPEDTAMPFLRRLFRTGAMVLAPLVNLGSLPAVVTLCAAPLGLAGSSAAPCRALAWEERETLS